MLVDAQWAELELFIQAVVCQKIPYVSVDVQWAELEQLV
jgi:hypothetical protein